MWINDWTPFSRTVFQIVKVRKRAKNQESIQSSTTPDPGYQWESDNVTIRHHKRKRRGQPLPSRDYFSEQSNWPQNCCLNIVQIMHAKWIFPFISLLPYLRSVLKLFLFVWFFFFLCFCVCLKSHSQGTVGGGGEKWPRNLSLGFPTKRHSNQSP